jgi:hypothetical protein
MPVRDDFIVPDLIDIRRDEINLLAFPFSLPKVPVKCPRK